jgi:hypothetical protein
MSPAPVHTTINPAPLTLQVIYRASQAAGPMAGWVKANIAYAAVMDKVSQGLGVGLTRRLGPLRQVRPVTAWLYQCTNTGLLICCWPYKCIALQAYRSQIHCLLVAPAANHYTACRQTPHAGGTPAG